ncbi:amidohydrolase [Cryobacterium sp. TMT4-10]|uniref:amidohydrolase n=1 Tax=Cryobacterium sp. TMT4-10 TaxID=1259256 RepID=UPI001F53FA35|nr:amidohydrolase [Cryobacterium sp. TMT4-10]
MSERKLDLLIRNATILTMDADRPAARSVGVSAGRIVAVGEELDGATADREVDAAGLTVLPGFNDVHCHTTWFGLSLTEVDLSVQSSMDDVYAALQRRAGESADGAWVVASGFNHQKFGGRYPDIDMLDAIAPRNPIYIRHNSGHSCIVNSTALGLAGFLAADYREEAGAVAVRDERGRFTGLLEERAQQAVQRLFLPYSQGSIVGAIDRATQVYATEGITSFTEAGIAGGWIGHSPLELGAYQTALETGVLRARAQLMVSLDALHEMSGHRDDNMTLGLDLGVRTGFGNDFLKIGPTKVFLDGSLLGLTAAMSEAYCAGVSDNHGYFQGDVEEMRQRILAAYRAGWSIAAHAIGDEAIDFALEVFEFAREAYGPRSVPNRIEHGGVITDAQLARLAAVGAVVVPQPGFVPAFGAEMARALGEERVHQSYRAASLIAAGIPLPGSSDRPVTSGTVLPNIQAFVERRYGGDQVYGPGERISVEASLRAYTLGSAEATGEAGLRGSIRPGKLGDFVFLDRNPLLSPVEEISDIAVMATVVGGTFIHDRL